MQIDNYVVDESTGCWLWGGEINPYGYGITRPARNRTAFAHKLQYVAVNGPIPEGLQLDHKCRIRKCVNPAHLEPVTNTENVRRGNACKLSVSDVEYIRSAYATGASSQKDLANRFGLNPATISRIVTGGSWVSEIADPKLTRRAKSSSYPGVSFNKNSGKWMAFISVRRKFVYIGLYQTELLAASAVVDFQKLQEREN